MDSGLALTRAAEGRSDTTSHSRGATRPSCAYLFRPFRGRGECRVPSAPAASCAKWVVQDAHEYSQRSHRKSPGIPARNGFTAYFVLSPAIGLSCHRRLADISTSARLGSRTSARLDAGVEASGPHDFAVRFSAVRLRAQGIAHGSIKPALRSHLARGHRRVHRIPPRVNDDGQRPSVGRDGESYSLILVSEKQKYFCKEGWTRQMQEASLICPSGNRIEPEREVFLRCHSGARGARTRNLEIPRCAIAHLRSVP